MNNKVMSLGLSIFLLLISANLPAADFDPIDTSNFKKSKTVLAYFLNEVSIRMGEKPAENTLYSMYWLKPIQKIEGGYLLSVEPYFAKEGIYGPAFLYTDKVFLEGQHLGAYYAYYVGEFNYQAITGFERSIPAFRIASQTDFKSVADEPLDPKTTRKKPVSSMTEDTPTGKITRYKYE